MWQEFRLTQRSRCAERGSIPLLRIVSAVGGYKLGQEYGKTPLPYTISERLQLSGTLYNLTDESVKEEMVIYIILAGAFMIACGIVIANYELARTQRMRREQLRTRTRRCIRRDR